MATNPEKPFPAPIKFDNGVGVRPRWSVSLVLAWEDEWMTKPITNTGAGSLSDGGLTISGSHRSGADHQTRSILRRVFRNSRAAEIGQAAACIQPARQDLRQ
jgi:hypothetical protein